LDDGNAAVHTIHDVQKSTLDLFGVLIGCQ